MPSPNPRIQVCTDPALHAAIKTLAKARNQTLSNVVQDLCREALQTEATAAEYQEACRVYGEVPVQEDKRKRPQQQPHFKAYESTRPKEGSYGLVKRQRTSVPLSQPTNTKTQYTDWEAECLRAEGYPVIGNELLYDPMLGENAYWMVSKEGDFYSSAIPVMEEESPREIVPASDVELRMKRMETALALIAKKLS